MHLPNQTAFDIVGPYEGRIFARPKDIILSKQQIPLKPEKRLSGFLRTKFLSKTEKGKIAVNIKDSDGGSIMAIVKKGTTLKPGKFTKVRR